MKTPAQTGVFLSATQASVKAGCIGLLPGGVNAEKIDKTYS